MKKQPEGTQKKTRGVCLTPALWLAVEVEAARQRRSVAGVIQNILEDHLMNAKALRHGSPPLVPERPPRAARKVA